MSFHALIAALAARPLRPTPLADVQARLDKLKNQVADPFHTVLTKFALHDTAGMTWNSWALAARPTFRPGAICLGMFPEVAAAPGEAARPAGPIWHALTTNPLGRTTLATFGEEKPLGEFVRFVAETSRLDPG